MWPHINNSLYENDFEIKVMRSTCKNHRAGKIWFPSKSNSQVKGCLSPRAIIRLDVFFLTLVPDPQPSPLSEVSTPCFTEHLFPARKEAFPSPWRRQEPLLSLLQRVMQLLPALWPGKNAAINTLTAAHPASTGHTHVSEGNLTHRYTAKT